MKFFLRWSIRVVLGLLLLFAIFLTIVIAFKIPLDLTRFKEPVEAIVSKALDRPVRIEQSIVVSTSLKPYFTLEGLKIENPEGFATDNFLSMDLARIQLELLPLLKMKVHLSEIQVQGLDITLEETAEGKTNWVFNSSAEGGADSTKDQEPPVKQAEPKKVQGLTGDTLVVRKLELRDIKVDLHRPEGGEPSRFLLDSCLGAMIPGEPMHLDIDGKVLEFDYAIDVSIGSLEELLTENKSWLEIKAAIAQTEMTFSGNVDLATAAQSLTMQMTVEGENLASLNDLLQVDLPPFKSYRVETGLHLQQKQYELQKLLIKTGSSSLEGSAKVIKADELTSIDLQLRSPLVQIDDFVFEEWSWSEEEVQDDTAAEKEEAGDAPSAKNKKLFDSELLSQFDCSLSIVAEKVLSGEDVLGNGQLKATVKEGRIDVDPLIFKIPGGKIEMMASVKPGAEKSDARLKVEMENFDIGILVRRSKPESDMGGLVNVDLDLQSSAATISELLAHGNGYFDFSGKLENFGAGIIDLWAVNLVAAIVSNTEKEQSGINCAVGRWTATDGLLEADAFFIDTSKIRICAKGTVDFTQNRVDIEVKPKAKKAEFFSLATPLEVHGSFSDINIGVKKGGIAGTVVRFIASPLSVPIKRTVSGKIPADGSDVCNMALGPDDRDSIEVPVCSRKWVAEEK